MNNRFIIYKILLSLLLTFSCSKEEVTRNLNPDDSSLPTVITSDASAITSESASCGGNVSSDGGAVVTSRGVCWNTSQNPVIADNKTTDGFGTGAFLSNISGLAEGSKYYVRAYATNKKGTAYGNEVSFTTTAFGVPILTTTDISNILSTSASSGGVISSDGGSSVTAKGVCWSTSQNPTTTNSKTNDGSGIGSFSSSITGLTPGITYYVRAYATNSIGTGYGSELSFTTEAGLSRPTVETISIISITTSSAIANGNVSSQGGAPVTMRGVCWSTNPDPSISDTYAVSGSGTGSFSVNITPLSPGTTYYVRSFAINSNGTSYGNELSFSTQGINAPILISPINGVLIHSTIYMTWGCVGSLTEYELQVAVASDFPEPITTWTKAGYYYLSSTVTQSMKLTQNCYNNEISQMILAGSIEYQSFFWRVRAISGGVSGPWSNVGSFSWSF